MKSLKFGLFKFYLSFILVVLLIIVVINRFHRIKESNSRAVIEWDASQTNKLYSLHSFKLYVDDKESNWSDVLATKLNGEREVIVTSGRIDVLTEDLAIEVERISKWHEGIGQALHYGMYTGKKPTLALIMLPPKNQTDIDTFETIEKLCKKHGINLIVLTHK